MKARSAHSVLQNRILLSMESDTFASLAELATKLHVHRSSVSRAMHALQKLGLVTKAGKKWTLTPEGDVEIVKVGQQLSAQAAKTTKMATRLLEQGGLAKLAINQATATPASIAIKVLGQDASALTALHKLAGSVAELNSITLLPTIKNPLLEMATKVDLASSMARSFDHLTALERVGQVYLDALPKIDVSSGVVISAQEALKPLISAAERFDHVALLSESLPRIDSPIYQGAANLSLVGKLVTETLKSSTFTSVIDSITSAAIKPSAAELMAQQVWPVLDDYSKSIKADLFTALSTEALASLTQSQQLNLASMEQLALYGKGASPILAEFSSANMGLSQMICDVGTIQTRSFMAESLLPAVTQQLPDIAAIARTYKGYMAEVVGTLGTHLVEPAWNVGIVLPTQATSVYIGSVTSQLPSIVIDEKNSLDEYNSPRLLDRPTQFDAVFDGLGPNFGAMWRGSWTVLVSDSPDRIRQAAHSGRELLMQALAYWAPDSCFSEDELKRHGHEGKPTRKLRAKKILQTDSHSKVEWVEALAKALEETYNNLAATSHNRDPYPNATERQLVGLLQALGGLLVFIDSSRPKH